MQSERVQAAADAAFLRWQRAVQTARRNCRALGRPLTSEERSRLRTSLSILRLRRDRLMAEAARFGGSK